MATDRSQPPPPKRASLPLTSRRIIDWGLPLLGACLVLVVLFLGSRSTKTRDPGQLPAVGSALTFAIPADLLPSAGQSADNTVLFVSDNCALCRQRASAYIAYLEGHKDALLVVGESEIDPIFRPLAHAEVAERIVYFPVESLRSRTGVRTVPSYVRVNPAREVTEAGMSNVGWLRSIMDPRRWLESWLQVFSKAE